jgi:putative flippase GtrA
MSDRSVTKNDYLLVSIVGLFFGLFALPAIKNIKIAILPVNFINGVTIVLCFTILSVIALWLSVLLNKKIPVFQITKFAATGSLNTSINFGVLNILMILTDINIGIGYTIFVGVAFLISNVNSYFWNKYWTYSSRKKANIKEYGEFITVSLIGLFLTVVIASATVNLINRPASVSPQRWANIGSAFATIVQFLWNFGGYKFIVFKEKETVAK